MAKTANFTRITPSPADDGTTPLPRSSHGISALNDGKRIVIYGGENIARTPISDPSQYLWVADKSDEDGSWKWTNPSEEKRACGADGVPLVPPWRVAHSQAVVGNVVYIFGGRAGVDMSETAMNDMWKLELSEGASPVAKWTEVKQEGDSIPEERSFHKMIAIGTHLYMFGGVGASGRLNDLWKFDTATGEWSSLGSSLLRGRGGPNILSLSGTNLSDGDVKIAVVAGFAGEETNDGHIYSKSGWEANMMNGLSDLRKRSVCCFGSFSEFSFVFGGEVDPSNKGHEGAGGFANDLVILNGESGALDEVIKPKNGEEWPEARGWADATTTAEDTFFIFGGLTGDDTNPKRLNDLWECKISK